MANYSNLKTAIENAVDWNNGDNEITGQNLLDILETIIDSLGAKYKFADVATPSSSITTPDEPLFYLAGAGTYTNFSGLSVTIPRGTLAIFYYDTAWHYTTVRTDSDAFFNVNQHLGTPSTTYTKADGRNAVPSALRSKGMIITYLTTNGWIIEQNLSTSGTWNADANWQTIGPVSVSQNTLIIGGEPTAISSQVVNVNKFASQSTAFADKNAARMAVDDIKEIGMVITYLLSDSWHIEQYRGDTLTNWKSGNWYELKQEDVLSILSLNRFDKSNVVIGYVDHTTGLIATNSSFRTSDYLPVEYGKKYKVNNNYNLQVVVYDKDKNFLAGWQGSNSFNIAGEPQIPEGGAFLRFAMRVDDLSSAGFYESSEYIARNAWENVTDYKTGIIADKVKGKLIERTQTVANMNGLLNVLATIIDTEHYHYTIYMEEGVYTLTAAQIDSLQTEAYGRIGILLPNNVDLIGLGKGATIWCDLTGQETGYQKYISPLNLKWNNKLKNIHIGVNNCRYAVHCDNSNNYQDIRWEIEDCSFLHYGNSDGEWEYPCAWGEGACSGHYAIFRNCTFIGPLYGFYMHNNYQFDKPLYHEFDGCRFISSNKEIAFACESLGSGTEDVLNIKGCTFDGLLQSRLGSAAQSGIVDGDFKIIGFGNSPVAENWYYPNSEKTYHTNFSDEGIEFINKTDSSIAAGTFMKYDSDNLVPMVENDDTKLFVGICMDNVASGKQGFIKTKGCYRVTTPAEVVWATLGTKVKVASYNSFGVATDIYNIGKMYYRNQIYQRYYILLE